MSLYAWFLLIAGSALALFVASKAIYWIVQGRRIFAPGYISPRPSFISRILRVLLGRALLFWFVGPVRVVGASNLGYFGRIIALANHQTERDALIMLKMMGARPVRYFIAENQARGLRAPLVAYTGGIVVHPGAAAAASGLRAAMTALEREQECSFIIFPQGSLNRDNKLVRTDFRGGMVMLASNTASTSAEPVSYLPFGIFYDRDPDHATAFHRVVDRWMGIKRFRRFFGDTVYGASVAIGAPIPAKLMPNDVDAAVDVLFQQVCTLSQRAERIVKDS